MILELFQEFPKFLPSTRKVTTLNFLIYLFFYQVSKSPCGMLFLSPNLCYCVSVKCLTSLQEATEWGAPGSSFREVPAIRLQVSIIEHNFGEWAAVRKMLLQGKGCHPHTSGCYRKGDFAQPPCFEHDSYWPTSPQQPVSLCPASILRVGQTGLDTCLPSGTSGPKMVVSDLKDKGWFLPLDFPLLPIRGVLNDVLWEPTDHIICISYWEEGYLTSVGRKKGQKKDIN